MTTFSFTNVTLSQLAGMYREAQKDIHVRNHTTEWKNRQIEKSAAILHEARQNLAEFQWLVANEESCSYCHRTAEYASGGEWEKEDRTVWYYCQEHFHHCAPQTGTRKI